MAIYHTRVKTFSRAQGHSSTAAAAYRAGMLIVDPRTGIRHDYRRRGGVVQSRVLAPADAPDWVFDPGELWGKTEAREARRDATVCREFEVSLPHELDDDQRSELTSAIARELVDRYRFVVQASIHSPQTPDGLNHHAHLLATTRRIGPDGLDAKTRELDGGPSGRGEVEWVREMVAKTINAHLAAAKIATRVDHRSLKDQAEDALERGDHAAALALTREPKRHLSRDAIALKRKGADLDIDRINAAIDQDNEDSWQAAIAQIASESRLLPTSKGHDQEQARKDRGVGASPDPDSDASKTDRFLRLPSRRPDENLPDREAAALGAFTEAARLWAEDFATKINANFKATTQLLRLQADRLATHVHAALFRADVRELLKLVKKLKQDVLRFSRRLTVEERAQISLAEAEFSLERFDSDQPQPGVLKRSEWGRRRARRLRAVQVCREAYRLAHEATGPEAQNEYNARAMKTAQELEAWSQSMLTRYPVEPEQEPVVVEAGSVSADANSASVPTKRGMRLN